MRTELSDGTLVIRAYTRGIEQAEYEAALESLTEIAPHMATWRGGATLSIAAKHVEQSIDACQRGAWYDFAIGRVGPSTFLCRVGLDRLRPDGTANVGYWVRTSQTRRGIATAAVRLIARFGFEDLGLRRLELLIATDNFASRRVAEKVGARLEGIRSGGDLEHDSYCFVLARDDVER